MFSLAQTFKIDSQAVDNSSTANVTRVILYFRAKPRSTGNKSGIFQPGVFVGIAPTYYGIPYIGQSEYADNVAWTRLEYGHIVPTPDAVIGTSAIFPVPITIDTDKEYAIIVKYDGNEDFLLWTNKEGDYLVGTSNRSAGVQGTAVGKLYDYIGTGTGATGTGTGYSGGTGTANSSVVPYVSSQLSSNMNITADQLLSIWKPLDTVDLKFNVFVSRYFHNGFPVHANNDLINNPLVQIKNYNNQIESVSNNIIRVYSPLQPMEIISFDKGVSNVKPLLFGDLVYQVQPFFTGGTGAPLNCGVESGFNGVTANLSQTIANGSTFSWGHAFADQTPGVGTEYTPQYIVVVSEDHYGAGNNAIAVREVLNWGSDVLWIDRDINFTNAAAYFFAAPVGRLSTTARIIGPNSKYLDLITLVGSNAREACRFVNNCINAYSIADDGTGYSNDDYVVVTGFEEVSNELYGGFAAYANVITDASGNITSLSFTNTGAGFTNTQNMSVAIMNSQSQPSTGTGANLQFSVGSLLYTAASNGDVYFGNIVVQNFDASQVQTLLSLNNPAGTVAKVTHRTLYHSNTTANTISGKRFYVNNDPSLTDFVVQNGIIHNFSPNANPCIVSRSNQFSIRYANGSVANADVIGANYNESTSSIVSNTACLIVDLYSNNDYKAVSTSGIYLSSIYAKYLINNDYTNEHTNYGNAYAKHIANKVTFADGRKAEDLLVFLTGFRPPNTDFKVYARIHNSLDTESFELKDWTLLEQVDGLNVYSNPENQADLKEFTYNFPAFPNTEFRLAGTANTTLSSNVISGSGTSWQTNATANLQVNDLIKIYQPLFPNNYHVGVVATVGSDTSLTLAEPISNNGLVGEGLIVEKIEFPRQAFNNILNSNVATYFNSTGEKFETYDTFQLKVIFLSPNDKSVPKMDDVRGIGTSA